MIHKIRLQRRHMELEHEDKSHVLKVWRSNSKDTIGMIRLYKLDW